MVIKVTETYFSWVSTNGQALPERTPNKKCICLDRVSLCDPGWHGTTYEGQAGPKLTEICLPLLLLLKVRVLLDDDLSIFLLFINSIHQGWRQEPWLLFQRTQVWFPAPI